MPSADNLDHLIAMARSATDQREWAVALARWGIIRSRFPDRPEGYVGLGQALAGMGCAERADAALSEARARFPGDFLAAYLHAECATARHDWPAAYHRWSAMRKNYADNPMVSERLDEVLHELCRVALRYGGTSEQAFARCVAARRDSGRPVCLHFGCGPRLIDGYLNIDRVAFTEIPNGTEYFAFNFAERSWPIPDSSVDYVFSEDFIEHIPQKYQITFLAEAFRVLKAGCYHRVNTPCLHASMKRQADFAKGFAGMYFEEYDRWGHIALFTKGSLEELARLIGYRQVIFTAKGKGTSPCAVADTRPGADRDELTGNIMVGLLK
jgi:hypothetical protein